MFFFPGAMINAFAIEQQQQQQQQVVAEQVTTPATTPTTMMTATTPATNGKIAFVLMDTVHVHGWDGGSRG